MQRHPTWRLLLFLVFVGSVVAVAPGRPVQRSMAAATPPSADSAPLAPAPGSDLAQLDTDTGHYTQDYGGLTHLDLYNSPVGNPDARGWHLRELRVSASPIAGAFSPANVPFHLHIAATGGAPVLASLVNGGVTLGVGVAAIDGASPANVPGQAGNVGVTYPTIVSSTVTIPATGTNPLPIAGDLPSSTSAAVRLAARDLVASSPLRPRGRLSSTLAAPPVVTATIPTTSTVVATSTALATTTAAATGTASATSTVVATGTVLATSTAVATRRPR